QSMFVNYGPTSHLKIADITLGRRISIRKPNGLMLTPMKISSRIKKIFAGGNHSFAIDENGMIYAWGQNVDMNQISAGLHHTLVLLENSEVYSFGSTKYGQLGIGILEGNRKSPGFGETYALGNQRENDELLPFKIKCEEFGEIIEV
ncbi:43420_t:CDS:2, partial [Gigaspora margarita]